MPQKIIYNIPEIAVQTSALQRASGTLKEAGDKYQKMMDAMSNEWQGGSGKSFAEAAGRVEAGFVANRTALEQLIYDISGTKEILSGQDESNAKAIKSINVGKQ